MPELVSVVISQSYRKALRRYHEKLESVYSIMNSSYRDVKQLFEQGTRVATHARVKTPITAGSCGGRAASDPVLSCSKTIQSWSDHHPEDSPALLLCSAQFTADRP